MANALTPRKDFPRAVKELIRRRAHELSRTAYEKHVREISEALKAGALELEEIQAWWPAAGSQAPAGDAPGSESISRG